MGILEKIKQKLRKSLADSKKEGKLPFFYSLLPGWLRTLAPLIRDALLLILSHASVTKDVEVWNALMSDLMRKENGILDRWLKCNLPRLWLSALTKGGGFVFQGFGAKCDNTKPRNAKKSIHPSFKSPYYRLPLTLQRICHDYMTLSRQASSIPQTSRQETFFSWPNYENHEYVRQQKYKNETKMNSSLARVYLTRATT